MVEHTPTPWELDGCYIDRKGDERLVTLANCAHSPRIDIPTAKANAAFIVRAVNAHDDLVGALNAILVLAERYDFKHRRSDGGLTSLDDTPAIEKARAALAKAAS